MLLYVSGVWRVSPKHGAQLFIAVQKDGVPSGFIDFPGEERGIENAYHRVVLHGLALESVDHWLKGETVTFATCNRPRSDVQPPRPK